MSHARPEDEAVLRGILRAAADQVEPRADGLERIQHRLSRPRPLAVAWAMIAWTSLSMRLSSTFRYFADRVVTEFRLATERFMPPPAEREGRRARLAWLRPVAAMSTAVAVIGAVVYLAAGFSQVASQTGSDTNARGGGHHGRPTSGQSAPGTSQGSAVPQASRSGQPSSSQNPNCGTPGAKNQTPPPTISSAPTSTSPTGTTSPSPSPSPSQTPTPTPTPTPSSTSTAPSTNPGNGSSSPANGSSGTDSSAANQPSANGAKSSRPSSADTIALDKTDEPTVSASCPTTKPAKSTTHTISPDAAGPALAPAVTAEPAKGKIG
jgi:hypothetical protein